MSNTAKSTDHRACESHVKKRQHDMFPGENVNTSVFIVIRAENLVQGKR